MLTYQATNVFHPNAFYTIGHAYLAEKFGPVYLGGAGDGFRVMFAPSEELTHVVFQFYWFMKVQKGFMPGKVKLTAQVHTHPAVELELDCKRASERRLNMASFTLEAAYSIAANEDAPHFATLQVKETGTFTGLIAIPEARLLYGPTA